jgi:hypothetical protein
MRMRPRVGTARLCFWRNDKARRPGHVVIWTAGDSDAMRSGCRFLAPENPDLSQSGKKKSPDLSLTRTPGLTPRAERTTCSCRALLLDLAATDLTLHMSSAPGSTYYGVRSTSEDGYGLKLRFERQPEPE